MIKISTIRKYISFSLASILFATNCLWAHKPETQFWTDRRKGIRMGAASETFQLARLSMAPQTFPSIKPLAPLNQGNQKVGPASLANKIPTQWGTLQRICTPQNPKGRILLHLMDIHLNKEAQSNLSRIVQELVKDNRLSWVGLEGAFSRLPLDLFVNSADPNDVKAASDYLLENQFLSGPVHGLLQTASAKIKVTGIDDEDFYNRNIEAFRKSEQAKPVIMKNVLNATNKNEMQLRATSNPDLIHFYSKRQAYLSEKLSMMDYLSVIADFDSALLNQPGLFLEASKLEKELDLPLVEKERQWFLKEINEKWSTQELEELLEMGRAINLGEISESEFYRHLQRIAVRHRMDLSKTPHLNKYISYVLLSEKIDPSQLFTQIVELEHDVIKIISKNENDTRLIQESIFLALVHKLIHFSLTRDEWHQYSALKTEIHSAFDDALTPFEQFYEAALKRDVLMAGHILEQMALSDGIGAVVTGGFHSKGIEKQLLEKGVTIVHVSPRITKTDGLQPWEALTIFSQEKTPLEKLARGEKLFLAPAPLKVETAALAVSGQAGIRGGPSAFVKVWATFVSRLRNLPTLVSAHTASRGGVVASFKTASGQIAQVLFTSDDAKRKLSTIAIHISIVSTISGFVVYFFGKNAFSSTVPSNLFVIALGSLGLGLLSTFNKQKILSTQPNHLEDNASTQKITWLVLGLSISISFAFFNYWQADMSQSATLKAQATHRMGDAIMQTIALGTLLTTLISSGKNSFLNFFLRPTFGKQSIVEVVASFAGVFILFGIAKHIFDEGLHSQTHHVDSVTQTTSGNPHLDRMRQLIANRENVASSLELKSDPANITHEGYHTHGDLTTFFGMMNLFLNLILLWAVNKAGMTTKKKTYLLDLRDHTKADVFLSLIPIFAGSVLWVFNWKVEGLLTILIGSYIILRGLKNLTLVSKDFLSGLRTFRKKATILFVLLIPSGLISEQAQAQSPISQSQRDEKNEMDARKIVFRYITQFNANEIRIPETIEKEKHREAAAALQVDFPATHQQRVDALFTLTSSQDPAHFQLVLSVLKGSSQTLYPWNQVFSGSGVTLTPSDVNELQKQSALLRPFAAWSIGRLAVQLGRTLPDESRREAAQWLWRLIKEHPADKNLQLFCLHAVRELVLSCHEQPGWMAATVEDMVELLAKSIQQSNSADAFTKDWFRQWLVIDAIHAVLWAIPGRDLDLRPSIDSLVRQKFLKAKEEGDIEQINNSVIPLLRRLERNQEDRFHHTLELATGPHHFAGSYPYISQLLDWTERLLDPAKRSSAITALSGEDAKDLLNILWYVLSQSNNETDRARLLTLLADSKTNINLFYYASENDRNVNLIADLLSRPDVQGNPTTFRNALSLLLKIRTPQAIRIFMTALSEWTEKSSLPSTAKLDILLSYREQAANHPNAYGLLLVNVLKDKTLPWEKRLDVLTELLSNSSSALANVAYDVAVQWLKSNETPLPLKEKILQKISSEESEQYFVSGSQALLRDGRFLDWNKRLTLLKNLRDRKDPIAQSAVADALRSWVETSKYFSDGSIPVEIQTKICEAIKVMGQSEDGSLIAEMELLIVGIGRELEKAYQTALPQPRETQNEFLIKRYREVGTAAKDALLVLGGPHLKTYLETTLAQPNGPETVNPYLLKAAEEKKAPWLSELLKIYEPRRYPPPTTDYNQPQNLGLDWLSRIFNDPLTAARAMSAGLGDLLQKRSTLSPTIENPLNDQTLSSILLLLRAANHPDARERAHVARQLGAFRFDSYDPRASTLLRLSNDPDNLVAAEAILVLGTSNDARATNGLIALLEKWRSQTSIEAVFLRAHIIRGMRESQSPNVFSSLLDYFLKTPTPNRWRLDYDGFFAFFPVPWDWKEAQTALFELYSKHKNEVQLVQMPLREAIRAIENKMERDDQRGTLHILRKLESGEEKAPQYSAWSLASVLGLAILFHFSARRIFGHAHDHNHNGNEGLHFNALVIFSMTTVLVFGILEVVFSYGSGLLLGDGLHQILHFFAYMVTAFFLALGTIKGAKAVDSHALEHGYKRPSIEFFGKKYTSGLRFVLLGIFFRGRIHLEAEPHDHHHDHGHTHAKETIHDIYGALANSGILVLIGLSLIVEGTLNFIYYQPLEFLLRITLMSLGGLLSNLLLLFVTTGMGGGTERGKMFYSHLMADVKENVIVIISVFGVALSKWVGLESSLIDSVLVLWLGATIIDSATQAARKQIYKIKMYKQKHGGDSGPTGPHFTPTEPDCPGGDCGHDHGHKPNFLKLPPGFTIPKTAPLLFALITLSCLTGCSNLSDHAREKILSGMTQSQDRLENAQKNAPMIPMELSYDRIKDLLVLHSSYQVKHLHYLQTLLGGDRVRSLFDLGRVDIGVGTQNGATAFDISMNGTALTNPIQWIGAENPNRILTEPLTLVLPSVLGAQKEAVRLAIASSLAGLVELNQSTAWLHFNAAQWLTELEVLDEQIRFLTGEKNRLVERQNELRGSAAWRGDRPVDLGALVSQLELAITQIETRLWEVKTKRATTETRLKAALTDRHPIEHSQPITSRPNELEDKEARITRWLSSAQLKMLLDQAHKKERHLPTRNHRIALAYLQVEIAKAIEATNLIGQQSGVLGLLESLWPTQPVQPLGEMEIFEKQGALRWSPFANLETNRSRWSLGISEAQARLINTVTQTNSDIERIFAEANGVSKQIAAIHRQMAALDNNTRSATHPSYDPTRVDTSADAKNRILENESKKRELEQERIRLRGQLVSLVYELIALGALDDNFFNSTTRTAFLDTAWPEIKTQGFAQLTQSFIAVETIDPNRIHMNVFEIKTDAALVHAETYMRLISSNPDRKNKEGVVLVLQNEALHAKAEKLAGEIPIFIHVYQGRTDLGSVLSHAAASKQMGQFFGEARSPQDVLVRLFAVTGNWTALQPFVWGTQSATLSHSLIRIILLDELYEATKDLGLISVEDFLRQIKLTAVAA